MLTHRGLRHSFIQRLTTCFPTELLPESIQEWSGTSRDIENLIKFEDKHLLVLYKPPQILSQAEKVEAQTSQDLPVLLKEYRQRKGEQDFIGLVHRLDRPTSGLMVFAKHGEALQKLNFLISQNFIAKNAKKFNKYYLAVVNGKIEGDGQLIDFLRKTQRNNSPIFNPDNVMNGNQREILLGLLEKLRSGDASSLATSSSSSTENRLAITTSIDLRKVDQSLVIGMLQYKSLINVDINLYNPRRNNNISSSNPVATKYQTLLDISLQTGRKHQIRAQLAAHQTPVIGDRKYGASQRFQTRDICLHSYRIAFPHPILPNKMVDVSIMPPRIWKDRFPALMIQKMHELIDR